MSEWTVEIATLRTDRTVLDSVEATGVAFDRYIGKPGTFSCTIPAPSPIVARKLAPIIRDDAALTLAAYIRRGNDLWWGGRLDDPEAVIDNRGNDSVKISGTTFESYLDDRKQYTDIAWTNTEQLQIALDIWTAALAAEGNLRITLPPLRPSGVLRDQSAKGGDARTLASILNEVANRAGGFEWMINVYMDGSTRMRELVLGYPIIGGQDGPVFAYPGSIQKFSRKASTARTGTRFWSVGAAPQDVQGGGAQPAIQSAQVRVEGLLSNGAILLDQVGSYSDVSQQATIDQKTADSVTIFGRPIPVVNATVLIDSVSTGVLGTRPRLRVSHPFFPSSSSAPGYDDRARVIGIKAKPDERGATGTAELVFEEVS
jgi:hypothetical protein